MPLFKFLRHGDLKDKFKSTSRRDLNIKYTNFDYLKYWECHAYEYNHMNAQTMNVHWLGNKLISITREEQTVYYLYWDNDSHTKGNTVNYLNGVTTNIRKEIPSITSMG